METAIETILDEDGAIMTAAIANPQTRTSQKASAGKAPDGGYEFTHPNGQRELFETAEELAVSMELYAPLGEWDVELLD